MNNQITISGTAYLLKFTFASFLAMQEQHGVNVFAGSTFEPSPRLLAVLLWGGTLHANHGLTPQGIAAGLSMEEATKAQSVIFDVLLEALPKKKDAPAAGANAS